MQNNLISGSRLEKMWRTGQFVVTSELAPADSSDPQVVLDNARELGDRIDGINVTDGSGAHCHMASIATCAILEREGYESIWQISCRDRNRIAMQGDILGAAALGIKNVLCLTGDGVQTGDHPEAKPVFDLDSVQLIQTVRIMRDHGTFLSGRELHKPPQLLIGGASNPFAPPFDKRPMRLAKKIAAGVNFIQTQYCYDILRLQSFMKRVVDMGLHERALILIGVGPLKTAGAAKFIRKNVPGVHIPDEVIKRMEDSQKGKRQEEGIKICVELIQQIREIEGIHGVHIMAYKQEKHVPEIIRRAGIPDRLPSIYDTAHQNGASSGYDYSPYLINVASSQHI